MFDTVLIANRGEIACRIIVTLRYFGIRSVAVYSDADARSRHVGLADFAVRLGPAAAAQSYLNIAAVIAAAEQTGAQAIHPGYGFLAENADFARACEPAGIVFIGPSPEAITTMGDKISAKRAVQARGVPTVPGVAGADFTDDQLIAGASEVGYPILIKPAAGGGGKGMHVVESEAGLRPALAAARREAKASFGDDTIFLERYLSAPRHIEVQVLADDHGQVIHLGERECSLQRRHQKVIEEAPSPLLDASARERICQAACETARSVGYRGAGTVEFIVSAQRPDEFFFMEMNTRLQVEHPVTEEITGFDLVAEQLRIAAGEPLSNTQDEVWFSGHSFEARVYAEDPAAGFLPTGGKVTTVSEPRSLVRVDSALMTGLDVSVDYDPMLAKLISRDVDRDRALAKLITALEQTAVFGFRTNVEFLRLLLERPEVESGDLDTGLIDRVSDELEFTQPQSRHYAEAALLLAWANTPEPGSSPGPWQRRVGWRLGPTPAAASYPLLVAGGLRRVVRVWGDPADARVAVDDDPAEPASAIMRTPQAQVSIGGRSRTFVAEVHADRVTLADRGAVIEFTVDNAAGTLEEDNDAGPVMVSPMPGTVVSIPVADGERVEAGDPVVVVEAMKMEHAVRAGAAGTVRVHVAVGDQVARGATLAEIVETGTPAQE